MATKKSALDRFKFYYEDLVASKDFGPSQYFRRKCILGDNLWDKFRDFIGRVF